MSYLDFTENATTPEYGSFITRKLHEGADHGFEPTFMPQQDIFDEQAA